MTFHAMMENLKMNIKISKSLHNFACFMQSLWHNFTFIKFSLVFVVSINIDSACWIWNMTLRIDFFSIVDPIGQMINFSVCNQTVIIPIISLAKEKRQISPGSKRTRTVQVGNYTNVFGGWYISFVLAISIIFFWFIYSILAAYLLLLGAW